MPKGYSRAQIALHWITAALILWQFVGNGAISQAWRAVRQGAEATLGPAAWSHILAGAAVLVLVVWRIALRRMRGAPPAPGAAPVRLAASVAHLALYLLLVGLAVSGAVAWFGGVGPAMGAHKLMKTLLLALVGLHVLAAIWHQFWLRDGLMERMRRPLD